MACLRTEPPNISFYQSRNQQGFMGREEHGTIVNVSLNFSVKILNRK